MLCVYNSLRSAIFTKVNRCNNLVMVVDYYCSIMASDYSADYNNISCDFSSTINLGSSDNIRLKINTSDEFITRILK